jgi:hypothetical protein
MIEQLIGLGIENKIEFYREDTDNPCSVNGFRGTWNISDHTLIPQTLLGFLTRHFGVMRLRRVPMKQINELLNEVWEGPGSLAKIFRLEEELKLSGRDIKFSASDLAKLKQVEVDDEEDSNGLFEILQPDTSEDDDE